MGSTIERVLAYGLRGKTPEGGWANELQPEDCVHTIIAVVTGDGIGWGSVFTSEALVKASLEILRPLLIGENALEPERVSEKLHQHTFWLGRGGSVLQIARSSPAGVAWPTACARWPVSSSYSSSPSW